MEAAERALLRQLQRSFSTLKNAQSDWLIAQRDCKETLTTIEQQSERLQCCLRVPEHSQILQQFPDLRSRLTNKMFEQTREKLEIFHKALKVLQQNSESVSRQLSIVEDVIQKYRGSLDVEASVAGTSNRPSLINMLCLLQDHDYQLRVLVAEKETMLESLDLSSEISVNKLCKDWMRNGEVESNIKDTLCLVQFFLEETI